MNMSWALEEWKEGLSTKVLHKIQELESQVEKFKKERQQRQFQLESLETALQKQKQKVEHEKNEGATLKRENQNLIEHCDNLEKNRQKLFHELQVKEAQINFQEAQLTSNKKQVERLEQELKRFKSEQERQPKTSGDAASDNTPQRRNPDPLTPYNDSNYEELQIKPCRVIEERKHLEAEQKSIKPQKKINLLHLESNKSRREIARQQASSSVFLWQQEQTPSRPVSSPQSCGSTKSRFPGESLATPSHGVIKLAKKEFISCSLSNSCKGSPIIDQLKAQNQELRSRIQELEHKLQIQTQDMNVCLTKHQDIQLQLENIKAELTEKDKTLSKARNEITKMAIQLDQTTHQLAEKEEKFRRLSDELNCQRQNAESARCTLQQKIKDKDKEYQEILTIKEQLEKNAKDRAQQLGQLEQAMQTMQLKKNELKETCEEVKKQNKLLSCHSAQQLQEMSQLKEELSDTKLLLQQNQNFTAVMKNKNCLLERELKLLEEKVNKQENSVILEKIRLTVSDLEHEQDSLQKTLKHKEKIIEELHVKLENMETLQKASVECEGLKKEIVILSQWEKQSKQLLKERESEREGLMSKICSLECALMAEQRKHHERISSVEDEREKRKMLEQEVKDKTTELEAQRKAYSDLQQKIAMSEEKHLKESENNSLKLSECTKDLDILRKELRSAANEVSDKGKCIVSLEELLASHIQLNAFLQKEVVGLVQIRDEMGKRLAQAAEPRHQDLTQEMQKQIRELQETVFQKQELLSKALTTLEGKNKSLQQLVKESDRQQTEIEDLKVNNLLLENLVWQLKIIISQEPDLSATISLDPMETERLQDERSSLKNTVTTSEEKNIDLMQDSLYLPESSRERKERLLKLSQRKQEKNLLLSEADEEGERKCISVEPKEEYLKSAATEQACHLEIQRVSFDPRDKQFMSKCEELQNKLMPWEEKNNILLWQLEKDRLVAKGAKSLSQNGTAQNNRQFLENILLRQLITEIKRRSEHAVNYFILERTTLEHLKVFVEEREDELNKYLVKPELFHMELEDKESDVKDYADQVKHLEMVLKTMEIKMEQSETEKEKLLHKLQELKDLQNSTLEITEWSGNDQSPTQFTIITKVNFNQQKDAKSSSVLHDLMPSQNDYLQLVSSLHMTMSKLNELEKMCEHLQKEKSALASQLNNSQLECSTSTDTVAKELVEKLNRLHVETTVVSGKLIGQSKMEAQSGLEQVTLMTPEYCEGFGYEHLKLVNREIRTQLEGVRGKVFSLKNKYDILDLQNLNVASRLSELQSCIEVLREKDTPLLVRLNQGDAASLPVQMALNSMDKEFTSDGKVCVGSLCCRSVFSSTETMLMEPDLDKDEHTPSNDIGGLNQNKQVDLEDTAEEYNSAEELHGSDACASLTKQEAVISKRYLLKNEVKHLLCESCENPFKMLKKSVRSHKILEDKDIEKTQELLLSAKKEVDGLQKENISGNEHWQQKLCRVILQVTPKLPAEKPTELLLQKQELQKFDLSSYPPLFADTDQMIPANQQPDLFCYMKMDNLLGKTLGFNDVNDQAAAKSYETNSTEKRFAFESDITPKEKYLLDISSETNNSEDKSIYSSSCPAELSFPSYLSTSTMVVNFMENWKATEMLWLQLKKAEGENSKFFLSVEESNERMNTLLMEVQYLYSDLNSKNKELAEKETTCVKYGKTVTLLEQEKEDLSKALKSVTTENQQLSFNLLTLELELNKVKSELEMHKIRLSDTADVLAELQLTKAECTERFLEAEAELKRIKSEKTRIETYSISMEADLEGLQSKNRQLEQENQINLKTIFGLRKHLQIITAERNQLSQDLITLSRDNEVLDQMCQKLKDSVKELDSNQTDSAEFITILEAEGKTQAKLLQAARADVDRLSAENDCYMEQLQNFDEVVRGLMVEKEATENQIKCLAEAREVSLKENEILNSKLCNSEAENTKLSKSLEGSLIEKGELAARLNSAQEEVGQMRRGIEKLKIKIESDERSRCHLAKNLKESKQKIDSLSDKIEHLERELQMSEENLEDAIIRTETAKAETEIMTAEIERLRVSQQHLESEVSAFKSEKEGLEKELKEKQDKVVSLEISNSTIVKLLEEKEKEKVEIKGDCENALRLMESQLKQVCEEIKLSHSKEEMFKSKEEDLINEVASLRSENVQLVGHLEEAKSKNSKVEQLVEVFLQENFKQELNEHDSVPEPQLEKEDWQAAHKDLQMSFKHIEEKSEAASYEKNTLFEKTNSLNQTQWLQEKHDSFCNSFHKWLNAYKRLKQEKAVMEKQILELEAQLKMAAPRFHMDLSTEKIRLELEELRELVEEKTQEANQNLEKYCTLIINHDKLGEENEMLRTQVSLLNTHLKQLSNDTSSPLQRPQSPKEFNSRLLTEKTEDVTKIKKGEKCQEKRSNENSSPGISPQTSKIQRMDLCLLSPSLRSPALTDNSQIIEKHCFFDDLKTTAEGGRLQKMNFATEQVNSLFQDFPSRAPLSACNPSSQAVAERSDDHLDAVQGRHSLNIEENMLDEACHVQ